MCHPLYPVACNLVGRPVRVHHVRGTIHSGILQSVNQRGIYVLPQGAGYASTTAGDLPLSHAIDTSETDHDLVFVPAAFFAFGALTGLAVGAAAGGYGYGYGYPYYW